MEHFRESPGEDVKIRIQSMISNSFVDSEPFQLLSTEVIVTYNLVNKQLFMMLIQLIQLLLQLEVMVQIINL